MSIKHAARISEQYTVADFGFVSSLGGFYSVPSGVTEYVPSGRLTTVHNKTTIDGRLVVDGRVGSL